MRNIIGQPVSGDDFWKRPEVTDQIVEHLAAGTANIKMFGLRRIGKSSVLRDLVTTLRARGLTVIHVDTQKHTQFRPLMADIVEALPTGGKATEIRKGLSNNKLVSWLIDRSAEAFGATTKTEGFVNEFNHHAAWSGEIEALLKASGPVVLILDELPIMARNMLRSGYRAIDIEQFLATLRSWRFECNVRMLFAGSLGFGALERDHEVNIRDNISDLAVVPIPPLDRETAIEFVAKLAESSGFGDWNRKLSEAIVDESAELWPIFLQFGFDAAKRSGTRQPEAIASIMGTGVREQLDENFYSQFRTRLARYGDQEPAARMILKMVSTEGGSTSFAAIDEALEAKGWLDLRDDLLEYLKDDDFIEVNTRDAVVNVASKLVPVWVRARAWGR